MSLLKRSLKRKWVIRSRKRRNRDEIKSLLLFLYGLSFVIGNTVTFVGHGAIENDTRSLEIRVKEKK